MIRDDHSDMLMRSGVFRIKRRRQSAELCFTESIVSLKKIQINYSKLISTHIHSYSLHNQASVPLRRSKRRRASHGTHIYIHLLINALFHLKLFSTKNSVKIVEKTLPRYKEFRNILAQSLRHFAASNVRNAL